MKIHAISDLHIEFADWQPDPATVAVADVVVLAGDIHQGVRGIDWARQHLRGKPVVYVAGNHEYYSGHWTRTLQQLHQAADHAGIHFLEDEEVVIGGVRFLGASLWTDFDYFRTQALSMAEYQTGLNDCESIKQDVRIGAVVQRRRLTPNQVLRRHQRSRAWLEARLLQPFEGKTVVVTHHLPSRRSVAPRFVDDPLTPGFASDLPDGLITRADLWVHGHTHESSDYRAFYQGDREVREVHVVCNPLGYPLARGGVENPEFDPGLLIEI